MRVQIHGSELAAATAAAALSWVGHQVRWVPHASMRWPALQAADWLRREPDLLERLEEGLEQGTLSLANGEGSNPGEAIDILWLALSPEQREEADELVTEVAGSQQGALILINNSTFPVGETERLETRLGGTAGAPSLWST